MPKKSTVAAANFAEASQSVLDDDERFLALELAFDLFNSDDDVIVGHATEEHDWHSLAAQVTALLEEYQDIRLLVWRIQAKYRDEGLSVFEKSLEQILNLIQESDFVLAQEGQAIGVHWLTSGQCLEALKSTRIVKDNTVTVDQMLAEIGSSSSTLEYKQNFVLSLSQESGYATAEGQARVLTLHERFTKLLETQQRIVEMFQSSSTTSVMLDNTRFSEYVRKIVSQLADLEKNQSVSAISNSVVSDLSSKRSTIKPVDDDATTKEEGICGSVVSRSDAITAIDLVIEYFQLYEPGHPAPMLLLRCRDLIGKSFEEIITDLLPEASHQIKALGGGGGDNKDI